MGRSIRLNNKLKTKYMAIAIDSIEILQNYFKGVLERAEHHAGNVEGVSLALIGAIIWKADREIEVRQYDGRPANVLWFWTEGNKYAMIYNHSSEQIELRERSQNGRAINSFDNTTTYKDIINVFNKL